ncbi:DUF2092 domain-containing protein [Pyxidicoccus xibeiensis]|uniref:DUF2092 domain-containing protein n=1 Tax=Pyxidicoccus xibeiensis TaxID=2906759 RepID=UPI0020A7ADDF|nr:DUF2092 domain-containing protein [Pyxidicoccus xibeiensis]MCP3137529.1 DUF2092 domain-containing protein [Pyxidicoccus xibeiensis]
MAGRCGSRNPGGRWGLALALLATAAPALGHAQQARAPREQAAQVDPRADRLLRQMSDFLAAERDFTVRTEGTLDVVLESGQKVQVHRAGDVRMQRPDRLRVDREGDLAGLQLYYDGRQLTVYGERSNAYATTPAPATVDATLDVAAERLGLEAPGADLLRGNPYAALTEDVCSGTYLGRAVVDGVPVHHLAFRNSEGVDWELWVEDGPRPLPRKYVITSRDLPGSPQYSVNLSDWNLSPRLTQDTFRFVPPPDAMRASFLAPGALDAQPQGGAK